MTTVFENPGIIDTFGITTMGVNVKTDESAIGFFGTGLKIAICVILRLGGSITIRAGKDVHVFHTETVSMRGKEFQVVCMDGQRLGFTTEMGKQWEAWMAYRELWSNAKDEGGKVYEVFDHAAIPDLEEHTQIIVDCRDIDIAHMMRGTFLIEAGRQPRIAISGVIEVYDGGSQYIFYRGIRAGKVPGSERSRYTYNILMPCTLTEDRTILSDYEIRQAIERAVTQTTDAKFISDVVTEQNEKALENTINFQWDYATPGSTFMATVNEINRTRAGELSPAAKQKMKKHIPKSSAPDGRPFSSAERAMLDQALAFVKQIGFPCDSHAFSCAQTLGEATVAIAYMRESKIVLSAMAFKRGMRDLAATLIEEHLHITGGVEDKSRAMQNLLFTHVVRLGEELSGISLEQVKAA